MTFTMPLTVRYMEVDQQGVVFNGWYLTWFDEAMAAFLESRGLPYLKMIEAGYDFHVVHTEMDWKAGVRWKDDIEVAVATARIGNTSFALDFEARRGTEVCCSARTVYVVMTADHTEKRDVPAIIADALGTPEPLLPG